jgi:UrcA family protein
MVAAPKPKGNLMMNRFGKIAAFALSVGLLAGASAKAADANVAIERVTVFYGDLDLAKPAGAKLLLTRIKLAANQVCGGRPSVLQLGAMGNFTACMKTAMDDAVTRLGNVQVAALYGYPVEQVASRN